MIERFQNYGVALTLALFVAAPAYAQSDGSRSQSNHAMPGMDMQAMGNQCAQMRQQMRPGSQMNPDMQRRMTQCDQMDAQMNNPSSSPPGMRQRTR